MTLEGRTSHRSNPFRKQIHSLSVFSSLGLSVIMKAQSKELEQIIQIHLVIPFGIHTYGENDPGLLSGYPRKEEIFISLICTFVGPLQ